MVFIASRKKPSESKFQNSMGKRNAVIRTGIILNMTFCIYPNTDKSTRGLMIFSRINKAIIDNEMLT